jgi:hypothetical protein
MRPGPTRYVAIDALLTVAEKVSALETARFFRERATLGSKKDYIRAINMLWAMPVIYISVAFLFFAFTYFRSDYWFVCLCFG